MRVFAHARNQVSLFDEVKEGFAALHTNFTVGYDFEWFCEFECDRFVSLFFQFSLAAHEVGCAKARSAYFQQALERLRLAPNKFYTSAMIYVWMWKEPKR